MELKTATNIGIILLFSFITSLCSYSIGSSVEEISSSREYAELFESRKVLYSEVKIERTRVNGLTKTLKQLSDENTDLTDLVMQLRQKPDTIKYVSVIETVIVPTTTIESFTTPPEEYIYQLHEDTPIAKFSYDQATDPSYIFETYELTFRNSIVITDQKTSGLLQISSSANPGVYTEFPIDTLDVHYITTQRLFEPNIGLGLTLSAGEDPNLLGSIFVSFFHPHENIDVLGLRVAANKQTAQFGLDLAGYNVAAHIPILTDLWVHGGIAIDINANPSGHFSIGTKF